MDGFFASGSGTLFNRNLVHFSIGIYKSTIEPTNLAYWVYGQDLAAYKLYLETYKPSGKNSPIKGFTIKNLNTKQKLLILDYLGFMDHFQANPDTLKADFLALLFGSHPQTYRTELSGFHKLKSAKTTSEKEASRINLEQVKQVFEKLGLKKHVKAVLADLQKLG